MYNEPVNNKKQTDQNINNTNSTRIVEWDIDEIESDGSANAFSGTESMDDEYDYTRIEDK
jgi:hypothetical protein